MKKYKAVIFDLNGVLILDKPGYQSSEFERRFFKRLGLSLNDKKEKEKIKKELGWTEDKFWDFVNNSWEGAIANIGLVKLIKELRKQGFKTAILSNTSGLIMRPIIKEYFGVDIDDLFDQIIISSEVGFLKPDPKIYELCLKKLGFKAEESIFTDDAEEYLEGARSIRMKSFLFVDNEKLQGNLRKIGIVI